MSKLVATLCMGQKNPRALMRWIPLLNSKSGGTNSSTVLQRPLSAMFSMFHSSNTPD